MTEVRLYGHLADRFGKVFHFALDNASPAQALRALRNLPGFWDHIIEHNEPGYRVLIGDNQEGLGRDDLTVPTGPQVIRFVPVVQGAKSGFGQILVGIVLIVAAAYSGGSSYAFLQAIAPTLQGIGVAMVIGGVSQLLASAPQVQGPSGLGNTKDKNYLFAGPANTISQGGPVPIGYGRLRVGGVVISAGIVPEVSNSIGQFGGLGDGLGTITGDGDTTPWVASVAVQ